MRVSASFVGVRGDGLVFGAAPHPLANARGRHFWRSSPLRGVVGFEVTITLDWQPKLAADGLQFDQADVTKLLGLRPGPSPYGTALRVCLKSVQNGPCRFSQDGLSLNRRGQRRDRRRDPERARMCPCWPFQLGFAVSSSFFCASLLQPIPFSFCLAQLTRRIGRRLRARLTSRSLTTP